MESVDDDWHGGFYEDQEPTVTEHMSTPYHRRPHSSRAYSYMPDMLLSDFSDLIDENDEIPSLDEIPTALILAGEIDEQTMMKATLKQQQKKALQAMYKKTNISSPHKKNDRKSENKIKKNKNVLTKTNNAEAASVDNSNCNSPEKTDDFEKSLNDNNLNTFPDESNGHQNAAKNIARKGHEKLFPDGRTTQPDGNGEALHFLGGAKRSPKSVEKPARKESKITERRDNAAEKGQKCRPNGTEESGPSAHILSFIGQLMGLDRDTVIDDTYDFKNDFLSDNRKETDDEDIPLAMKLGNLAKSRRNLYDFLSENRKETVDEDIPLAMKLGNLAESRYSSFAYSESAKAGTIPKKTKRPKNKKDQLLNTPKPSDDETALGLLDDRTTKGITDDKTAVNDRDRQGQSIEDIPVATAKVIDDRPNILAENRVPEEPLSRSSAPVLKLSKDVLRLADSRHVAFKKIRSKTLRADKVKCTACRRPECTSQNMEKIKEIIKMADSEGYSVRDVVADGNCMFAAAVDQLELHGDFTHNAKSLRELSVHWLIENPCSDDGTPFASFLEEEWDQYLQRMMGEGQWGDHIVLRAISQVLRRSIMILNPGVSAKRWTRIEAEGPDLDVWSASWVIFLGLAGEFHYMSLVPKDADVGPTILESLGMESMTPEEMDLYSLEGVEDVSVFEEDHIDSRSDLPLSHLSFMLKKIVPISCVDAAACFMASFCEESDQPLASFCDCAGWFESILVANPEDRFSRDVAQMVVLQVHTALTTEGTSCLVTLQPTGDVAEGTFVPQLNKGPWFSNVTDISIFCIRQDFRVADRTDTSRADEEYCLDSRGCQPGYTRIRVPAKMTEVLKTVYMPHTVDAQGRDPKSMENGIFSSKRRAQVFKKQIIAIPCSWPRCAGTWKARPRREGWPSGTFVDAIQDGGCCLIGVAHKLSKSPETEWQFSFAVAEKKIMWEAVSANQKYCYVLFKALCLQALESSDLLTIDHLKQIFFYACERIPAEFWSSSIATCVLYMVDGLLKCLKEKNLPNYFVPSNNMVSYFSSQQLANIASDLERMRVQPVLYLRQISENGKLTHNGGYVIDKILDDIPNYKTHRSLRMSTLEVFVPINIEIAHKYITARQYGEGFNMMSQAYEERLAVNTCDDSVPYQLFLSGALGGLNHTDLMWFSVYADRHSEGQIPMSIISEVCSTDSTMKINQVLPDDVTAGYGRSLVPRENTHPLTSFCSEFAKFLYFTEKKEDCLPVLYFCRNKYQDKLKQGPQEVDTEQSHEGGDDFPDEFMIEIYTAICRVYHDQQQYGFFDDLVPELLTLCEKLNKKSYYQLLVLLGKAINNYEIVQIAEICAETAEEGDLLSMNRMVSAYSWPNESRTNLHAL